MMNWPFLHLLIALIINNNNKIINALIINNPRHLQQSLRGEGKLSAQSFLVYTFRPKYNLPP